MRPPVSGAGPNAGQLPVPRPGGRGYASPMTPLARPSRISNLRALAAPAAALLLTGVPASRAQDVPDGFTVETVASGLASPAAFDFLPDGRVLFTEQFTAFVRVVRPGSPVQANPVISVPGVAAGGERGLLGIAVDPAFPARPYLYLHYDVATPNHIRIARYTLSGDLAGTGSGDLLADPATRYDLVDNAPDNAGNHNGGTVRFVEAGVLYVSLGEDAVACAAQDPRTLRGVILRMRTDELPPGPGAAFRAQVTAPGNPFASSADSNLRIIGAYGLRNPFRFQVDPTYGTLAIGDVGAAVREELSLLQPPVPIPAFGAPPSGSAPLGANFGWPWREGTVAGPGGCGTQPPGLTQPVYDYDRTQQQFGAAIISAGFYRQRPSGADNWPADHDGDLFANDYYTGVLRRIKESGGVWSLAPPISGQPTAEAWGTGFQAVSDWRLGSDGALWYCRQSVNFQANTGSIGRVRGPGGLGVPPGTRLSMRLLRSPAVGVAELRVSAESVVRVRVMDLAGRPIRTLWEGWGVPAVQGYEFTLSWDGRTDGGELAPPGMYVAFVESAGRQASVRIPFLR